MRQLRLLIACGGTGGHIFPAVALADGIKKYYPEAEILFAGKFNGHMQGLLRTKGYEVNSVAGAGMPYRFNILFLSFILKAFSSFMQAVRILKEWQPDTVVSMGSFSGGPFVLAAKLAHLPTLIHEQNVIPGRANRISAYFADRIATSFEGTSDFFSRRWRSKIVYTGNPLRSEIFEKNRQDALDFFGFAANKFTILVMGGSQGAQAINKIFIEAARDLDKDNFQILHLSGKIDFDFVSNEYKKIGITNRVFAFLDEIGRAYAVSDLVICRSGAITITEITAAGLASILIPYPHQDAHQKENAKALERAGAGIVIQQEDLTRQALLEAIKDFSENKTKLDKMRANSKSLARPDAGQRLAKEVLALVRS